MSKLLDFVSYDSYPKHKEEPDPAIASYYYDWFRSMKNASFWIMELQSGMSAALGKMPRPGEIKKWTYQAIAHGADGIVYFRWRTTAYGVEQFWHGILGHDNRLNRRYAEVSKVGEEVRKLETLICNSTYESDVAILFSYDNMWAANIEEVRSTWVTDINPRAYEWSYFDDALSVHRGLWLNHMPTDIVEMSSDLTRYKLAFVPFGYVMNEELASNLEDFVRKGDILVSDARLAVKDEHNEVYTEPLPSLLTKLFGVTVDDYDIVKQSEGRKISCLQDSPMLAGKEILPTGWVEVLGAFDAEVLATHSGTWLNGKPAITRHKYGDGEAIHIGTFLSSETASLIVRDFIRSGLIEPVTWLDDPNVEVTRKNGGDYNLLFVINHADSPREVKLPLKERRIIEIDGKTLETNLITITLGANDVKTFILR